MSDGPHAVAGDMAHCIRQLMHTLSPKARILGIGVGSPGGLRAL